IDLKLSGNLLPKFAEDGTAVDFFSSGSIEVLRYGHLLVTDAVGEKIPSRLEPIAGGLRIAIDDARAIYPLTVDPLATSPAWTGSGDQNGALFGTTVARAGDVNGDGYSDVIVGAYRHDSGGLTDNGSAYLFLGSPSGLSATPAWTVSGDE